MGYRKLSARPRHHAKSEAAVAAFKKTSRPVWRRSRQAGRRQADRDLVRRRGPDRPEEQDHPPLGEARHPPLGPQGPEDGLGLHLRGDLPGRGQRRRPGPAPLHDRGHELASGGDRAAVAPGAHAVVLLDQAGWHQSKRLVVPDNITLMPLPAKAPELNPAENIWQYMRENWLSNRIFTSYDDIVRHITRRWIPFAERRGLEDMTLGPTAYLAAKAKGDRSMPSKRERSEDADDPVPQGPRDTVRTGLFEPQPPTMQPYIPRHSVLRRGHRDRATRMSSLEPSTRWAMGHHPIQGGERGTYVALDTSSTTGMWDRPTRREAQGDGAAVVLRGRESRPHGEGR